MCSTIYSVILEKQILKHKCFRNMEKNMRILDYCFFFFFFLIWMPCAEKKKKKDTITCMNHEIVKIHVGKMFSSFNISMESKLETKFDRIKINIYLLSC